jgi:hypothetical protein
MTESNERRVFTRILFDADTKIRQGDHAWSVVLIDLSLNGLLIEEPFAWEIDQQQSLNISIALDQETCINMEVTWRHTADRHVGFEILHIDMDSISHLRRLVELNMGDSSLLERQLGALGE